MAHRGGGDFGGSRPDVAVLGAGPAGLSAAWVLAQRGVPAVVVEADGSVGGLAKTIEFDGYRFDLGGHRFYTKLRPIEQMWKDTLGPEFLTRRRLSRIYYRGRFLNYPLKARDVFNGLGVVESTRCALSYLYWRRRLRGLQPQTFEDWVVSRFGRRLYDAFFRSYTEKVWGIPGTEIRSEWAAQRIQDFNLQKALLGILGVRRGQAPTVIESFGYPRLGPGQMWERFRERIERGGIPVLLNHRCERLIHRDARISAIAVDSEGECRERPVDAVLSSIPLSDLVLSFDPPAPEQVREAASRLRYRGLCLVALMTEGPPPFPDNWIYLHDPGIRAGRVQNFGAWSEDMVRPGTNCLGVEYFCFEEDRIWKMRDDDAVQFATEELARIGLLDPAQVANGVKIRVPKAYPMYDSRYRESVATIRGYLESFENLQTFGRNGLHRYNNQDHSMWTAMLATLSSIDGRPRDVWSVNTKAEFLEEGPLAESIADLDLALSAT